MPMAIRDGLRDLGVQVPRGEEQLRAEDQLDGPADVQVVAPQAIGQFRDGGILGDVLAEESLAEPPRQPLRDGGLVQEDVRKLVAVEAVGCSQDRLGSVVVPVRAEGIAPLIDRRGRSGLARPP